MYKYYNISDGQTTLDIAIATLGTIDNIYSILQDNNIDNINSTLKLSVIKYNYDYVLKIPVDLKLKNNIR